LTEQREQKSENNTARLFAEYARTRDPKLREQLIVQHLGLVSALARRFGADGRELDDLIQVGAIGLIQAIDRFDPSRGVAFRSYAVPTILGEMRRYFRDKASTIRLPRHLRELLTQANAASARLTQKLERPPSLDELAQAMSVPPEDLAVAEESAQAPVSLDQELPASEEEASLADYFGAEDAEMARLKYVNASHCSPVLYGPNKLQCLDAEGQFIGMFEDPEGRPWHFDGAVMPAYENLAEIPPVEDPRTRKMVSGERRIVYVPGTRRAQSAVIAMTDRAGERIEMSLDPLLCFQMKGIGYTHPDWGHGRWKGELAIGGESWKTSDIDPLAFENLHIQQVMRARMGSEEGIGVMEQFCIGPHAPSGFTDLIDGAK